MNNVADTYHLSVNVPNIAGGVIEVGELAIEVFIFVKLQYD